MPETIRRKRFVAWLPIEKHNQLKSRLVLHGEEMSPWLERQVDRFLAEENEK